MKPDLRPQLFLDVFTKIEPNTCSTLVLLHLGQVTFFDPCSEIFSRCFKEFLQLIPAPIP